MKKLLLSAGSRQPIQYIKAFQRLGAECILEEAQEAEAAGLVLCGGGDPDPALFGEENRGSYGIDRERDQRELMLIHTYLKAGKPILGICRGAQLLNIAFGGSLIQHLDTAQLHIAAGGECFHELRCGGLLKELYGRKLLANSSHHQGFGRIGRGLRPIAEAPDGIIEGFIHQKLPVLGVQFHPERMEKGNLLLEAFLKRC